MKSIYSSTMLYASLSLFSRFQIRNSEANHVLVAAQGEALRSSFGACHESDPDVDHQDHGLVNQTVRAGVYKVGRLLEQFLRMNQHWQTSGTSSLISSHQDVGIIMSKSAALPEEMIDPSWP